MRRFVSWWVGELSGLVPALPLRSAQTEIVMSGEGDRLRVTEERGGREVRELAAGPVDIERALAQIAVKRSGRGRPSIVLRLPRAAVFSRSVALPVSAAADAARILALDLEQATPFRRRDVMIAHRIMPSSIPAGKAGRVTAEQFVVKRSTVEAASVVLQRAGLEPDRIDIEKSDGVGAGGNGAGVDFLAAERPVTVPSGGGAVWWLALSAAVLAAAAVGIGVTRLDAAVEEIEARTATARVRYTRAEDARRRSDDANGRVAAIAGLKAREASRARVIEALTRLLPDTDYLTSLRIEGSVIEFAGYSASTATLVPLIERSGAFRKATPTAPATFDERAGRERFVIRAEIAGAEAVAKVISGAAVVPTPKAGGG